MNNKAFPHLDCIWSDAHDWDTIYDVSVIPDEPGYYVFTNYPGILEPSIQDRKVLYVGTTARSLRGRIRDYKNGDLKGVKRLHRGGIMLLLSRATVHVDNGKIKHSVRRNPLEVQVTHADRSVTQRIISPDLIYLRWAVDHRAAIEAKLIQQLCPRYNTVHKKQ